MKYSRKEKLNFVGMAVVTILLLSVMLMKDRLLLWQLHQSGVQISQSEFDALMKEAKSRPNSCSQGLEFNGRCYFIGAKGFMVPVGEPKN